MAAQTHSVVDQMISAFNFGDKEIFLMLVELAAEGDGEAQEFLLERELRERDRARQAVDRRLGASLRARAAELAAARAERAALEAEGWRVNPAARARREAQARSTDASRRERERLASLQVPKAPLSREQREAQQRARQLARPGPKGHSVKEQKKR